MRGLGRATRHWAQLAVQVILVLAIAALFQTVADRRGRRFDLTPGRTLSLSPLTRKVLGEVTAPLHVTVFFQRTRREQYADLLERLRAENRAISFELFDLDRFPELARSYGVSQYERAVIEYGGRRVVAPAYPEAELAGGILRALRGRSRRLVFTIGHAERSPGGSSESYGRFVAALAAENYTPDSVALLDASIPADADLVVVAGPKRDFAVPELDALAAYLKAGGGVLMLLDPGPLPNVQRFLGSLGVRLGDDFVVDRERRVVGTDGLAAVVEFFKRGNPVSDPEGHPIDTGIVLPSARTVDVVAEVAGIDAESIARTGPSAWAMHDPERAARGAEPSRAEHDTPGQASVAVTAEVGRGGDGTGHRRGRLVVVGDADFASDGYFDLLGNRDLAMNAAAWVAKEEVLTGVRNERVPEVVRPLSPLVLTDSQARGLFLGAVVAEPGLMLAIGAVVLAVRRWRG
jgi:ABC-type uncharacterized transport system involved in gliding motility auxiliary subunit